jgi:site-specific DNA recombinase
MTNRSGQIADNLTADIPVTPVPKAALYLRVSTGRQAESDLSIRDQRRQTEAYCAAKGWDVAAEFVEDAR